ncbi:amidohydrolase [Candidatus Nanohalovita haloferacivicina]|uniref:amidohydrolase n=1 Tax=Candidatus Nanohalovita haloferacivicina TaxID=2978046 RepID=UPI00325FC2D1
MTQNDDRQILENVDLLIHGDRIAGIGHEMPVGDHRVVDCSNKVVMPGLINSHTHASMTLLRGISDNKELEDWLHEDIFPAEEKLEAEDAYIGALVACIEMLSTGTTTFNDMYDHMDQVAEAVDQTGIRAMLGRGLLDVDGERDWRLNEGIELVEKYQGHERIATCFAPHGVYTASKQLLLEAKDCSEIFNTSYHIHVSETEKEVNESIEENEKPPLEYLDELDLVNEDLIAAHGVWLTEKEKELLSEKGGSVVHNPAANLKLGSGVADVPELLEREINVALGTDGVASNNNLNLFEEAKTASLIHKEKSPERIDEQQILDMATRNGAKALGLQNEIGSIEIGKKADMITIGLDSPDMTPIHGKKGLISNLVYSFSGSVDDVIVDGNIVVQSGEMVEIGREKVLQHAEQMARKFR